MLLCTRRYYRWLLKHTLAHQHSQQLKTWNTTYKYLHCTCTRFIKLGIELPKTVASYYTSSLPMIRFIRWAREPKGFAQLLCKCTRKERDMISPQSSEKEIFTSYNCQDGKGWAVEFQTPHLAQYVFLPFKRSLSTSGKKAEWSNPLHTGVIGLHAVIWLHVCKLVPRWYHRTWYRRMTSWSDKLVFGTILHWLAWGVHLCQQPRWKKRWVMRQGSIIDVVWTARKSCF